MKKIVLTGGHAGTTAIATIEALRERLDRNKWEICWIGPRRAFEGSRNLSLEFKALPEMGVVCHSIISGKIQSKFTRHTIAAGLRIPVGFFHALYLLVRIRPRMVLSFGGYAGVPVVVGAWILRIPVVIHEQVAAAGLGNRLSAPFAKKIAVARKDSRSFFPERKVVVVGNPILNKIAIINPKTRISKPPVLYVTGGSRGAVRINAEVEEILEELLGDFRIIHQTGEIDYEKFEKIRKRLNGKLGKRYKCFSHVSPLEVHKVYEKADIVIGRAGANTVSEVLAAGRPAIFIPIPWSIFNEQKKNALYAKRVGVAVIIDQSDLTSAVLKEEIYRTLENWKEMTAKGYSKKATFDEGAAGRLARIVMECA